MPVSFFDSNVLLYLISNNVVKADRSEAIVAAGGTISVQVLNEIANVARRKMRAPWDRTHQFLSYLRGFLIIVPVTLETHDKGIYFSERYGLSTYDAMIAASAALNGCDTLWSEDMQDGMTIDNTLRIINPFRPS